MSDQKDKLPESVEAWIESHRVCNDPVHNRPETLAHLGRCTCAKKIPVVDLRTFLHSLLSANAAEVAELKADIARRESERNEIGEKVDDLYRLLAYREVKEAAPSPEQPEKRQCRCVMNDDETICGLPFKTTIKGNGCMNSDPRGEDYGCCAHDLACHGEQVGK